MAALTIDRNTPKSVPGARTLPVAASVTCFAGGLASVDTSGYVRPGRTSTTDRCVGFFKARAVNGAVAGAVNADVECFAVGYFGNSSAGDLIATKDIGSDCFIVDDQTVALTNGTSTRIRAGKVYSVDSVQGVGVRFDQ